MSRERVLPEDRQMARNAGIALRLSETEWGLPTENQGGGAVDGKPRQLGFAGRLLANAPEINDFFGTKI